MSVGPLVSVIVPAFNAVDTIDATLRSVRAQTYRQLEILVVDDGSHDATASVVEQHAKDDPRIRLIRQPNGGVASARNRGIAEAKGDFVAPIDADDLWRPTKVEKEIAAMIAGGAQTGLAYSWQAEIDEHDAVISTAHSPAYEGNVFIPILTHNIVGSGSNALMRKQAVIECGGYDASLRANGGQGCEDLMLYVLIAERYRFALVREHLCGYRRRPGSMSTDYLQMLRSRTLVEGKLDRLYPEHRRYIRTGYSRMCRWLLWNAAKDGEYRSALILIGRLLASDLPTALKVGGQLTWIALRRAARLPRKRPVSPPAARRNFLAIRDVPSPTSTTSVGR